MEKRYKLVRHCDKTGRNESPVTELTEEELNALIEANVAERLEKQQKQKEREHQEVVSERQWWAIEKVAAYLEHSRLNEYVALIERPSHWIRINVIGGIARGIGMAIGFSLLGAGVFLVLQEIVMWNLPGISDFIAQILDLVENSRALKP
ncbi:MAG: DUF5665 domain-containing protein [Bacillota bacterium]|nr:DUF5665 domain-containing protein [Bacillota bacterium]